MPVSLEHMERVLRFQQSQADLLIASGTLTHAEREVFERAREQVDRVIGPKRIAELLAIFEIDSGTTAANVRGAVPAGDRRPANADLKKEGQ